MDRDAEAHVVVLALEEVGRHLEVPYGTIEVVLVDGRATLLRIHRVLKPADLLTADEPR